MINAFFRRVFCFPLPTFLLSYYPTLVYVLIRPLAHPQSLLPP